MAVNPLEKLKSTLSKEEFVLVEKAILLEGDKFNRRFPFVVPILGAVGVVATFLGLEKLINQTSLANNPWLLIIAGIIILLVTGVLYEKF
jgi:hypothetical protein